MTLMLSAFSDLLRVRRPPFDLRTLDFRAPTVEECARALKLTKKAKSDGRAAIPDAADTVPSGFELQIHQYVESQIAETKAAAEVALMGLDDQINRLDIEEMYKAIQRAPTDLRLEIEALTQNAQLALDRSREDLHAARSEYDKFRKERGIDRDPDYPQDKSTLLWLAFGVAVAEAVMNAWFFALGSEQGLIGGMIIAIVFAFGDILISFNLGRFIRKIVVPRWTYRLIGGTALSIFLTWAFSYNLLAGHLREALQTTDWSQAVRLALTNFLHNPIGLRDIQSWLLMGIGTVLTVFVMADGTRYDESWFNFERLHRRLRRAEEEYDYHKRTAHRHALDAKVRMANTVSEHLTHMQDNVAAREIYIERKEVLLKNYKTFIETSQEACRALVQLYRDENRKARMAAGISEAPEYYRAHHVCNLGHEAVTEQIQLREALKQQRAMLAEAQDRRLTTLKALDDAYLEAVEEFVQSVERAVTVGKADITS